MTTRALWFPLAAFAALSAFCGADNAWSQGGPPTTGQPHVDVGSLPGTPTTAPGRPEHDSYDSPVMLVTGTLREDSNKGAGAVAGELSPPLVTEQARSLWYVWTAEATGWIKIATANAEGYPGGYVAVWRETAAGVPVFEHKAPANSRFFLKAEAGARYRIGVAEEKTGSVTPPFFRVQVSIPQGEEGPHLEVISFSLMGEGADGEVDAGQGPVKLTARIGCRAPRAAQTWKLLFAGLDGLGFRFGAAQRVSGTDLEGVYEVPIAIPAYLSARRLYFDVLSQDDGGNWASAGFRGEAAFAIPGPPPSLNVVNTGTVDRTAPMLTRCAADRELVDVSGLLNTGDSVQAEFTLHTEDTSGVAVLHAALYDEDGALAGDRHWDALEREPDTVPATEWVWTDSFHGWDRPGLYELVVTCGDYNGNISVLRSRQAGFPGPFAGIRVVRASLKPQYPKWREELFPAEDAAREEVSGETADPDADGLPNFLEYALGLSPLTGDGNLGGELRTTEGSASRMEFRYTRSAGVRQDVVYEVQRAESPAGPWTRAVPVHVMRAVDEAGRLEEVRHVFTPAEGRAFFRLEVRK